MELSQVVALIEEQGKSIADWQSSESKRHDELKSQFDEFVLRSQRPGFGGGKPSEGMSKDERKAAETAIRAWVRGDQAAVDTAITQLKAMSAGSSVDGGYAVISQRGDMVRVMAEVSPLLGAVRDVPLTQGDALEGLLDRDDAAAVWVGEETARPDTDTPQVGAYRIPLHEIYAMPKISQKLIDVADIDVLAWATAKINEAFAVAQEAAVVSGDGIAKPRGMFTYPTEATGDATRAWCVFEHVLSGKSAAFADTAPADALIDLASKLKPIYRSRARWLMSRSTAATIRKFKDATSGMYIWQPGLTAGQPDALLGFPVVYCEALPAIASGSLSIAFGDFQSAYWTVRRPGVKLLTDPYTAKPHVRLYAYHRMGGDATNFEALKFLKFSQS